VLKIVKFGEVLPKKKSPAEGAGLLYINMWLKSHDHQVIEF